VRDYGIFALDIEGRVVSWNTGAERIKGWSADEILGQHFSTFYPADTRAETPARLLEVARREGRVEDEGWRLRRDGRRFWANVVITALYDHDGVLTGFSKVTRDVTERRRADEALSQARAEAERASRAKTDFLSRMSHELRTPLTAILGFNQLLDMDRETLTDDQVHAVEQIGKAGGHLLAMIEEVLDIAQIEAGGHALAAVPLAIQPLIEDVRSLIGPQAASAGVDIRLEVDGDLAVMADRRATLQIVLNLVSNAIKYGARGGAVDIACAGRGTDVCIAVSDEGPGIPPDLIGRLFTPFDRLEAERWSGVDGSGLGLALSQGLARAQGGDIVYRAREDRSGAVFVLTLPRSNLPNGETE
jgi:PAS domain S-box-containing protein